MGARRLIRESRIHNHEKGIVEARSFLIFTFLSYHTFSLTFLTHSKSSEPFHPLLHPHPHLKLDHTTLFSGLGKTESTRIDRSYSRERGKKKVMEKSVRGSKVEGRKRTNPENDEREDHTSYTTMSMEREAPVKENDD